MLFTVRPHNYAGLYPIFVLIGVGSFVLLPIALEIGVEVTSSAEASSAIFWCGANILSVVFVEVSPVLIFSFIASLISSAQFIFFYCGHVARITFPSYALFE